VVGSEGDASKQVAQDLHYIEVPNEPLDAKYDFGFRYARRFDPAGVALVGSDDFITSDYFCWAEGEIIRGHDMCGFLDCYMVDCQTQRLFYWGGYTGEREGDSLGSGRVFSREYLERCKWRPFYNNGYCGCYKDDERAERKSRNRRVINMANIGCRFWNIKTGTEIDHIPAYSGLVELTKYATRLYKEDVDFPFS
jgi:hypothetical protein